jgi:molybdopterin converting factor small subunit
VEVLVLVPTVLRADCGGAARLTVTPAPGVDGGVVLRGVLDAVADRHPRFDRRVRDEQGRLRRYVNVFVGDDECRALGGLDAPVPPGAEVRVLPSVAGG